MTVTLHSRDDFTFENFRRVARGREPVKIGEGALSRMQDAREGFMRLLDSDRTQYIYGVTSNFGPRAHLAVPPDKQREHARRRSTSSGRGFGGGSLDESVVRGIVFARLVNFVAGASKARPVLAERVAALLDGPMAPLPLDGQVGAGEVLPMAHVLRDLDRNDLEEGEGNALSNGAPCAAALVCDVALDTPGRLRNAECVFALSVEAFRAPLGAYDEALDDLWGDEDEAAALRSLRALLAGASTDRLFHQAPVSYRILGRLLGEARRAGRAVEKVARVSLRSVTDNPVYVMADAEHPLGRVLSTGGYHNGAAYPALNALSAAWADLALLAERQATALCTPDTSGLPLAARVGFSWVMSGFVEEARAAASPTLLPASVNDSQDDISSPTFNAYRQEQRAAESLDEALAALAAEASQALFVTGRAPAPELRDFLEHVRSIFPPVEGDSRRELGEEAGRLAESFASVASAASAEGAR
ncbi:MAG: aromatic amino acid lyase [Acidimicrobiales bacterium]